MRVVTDNIWVESWSFEFLDGLYYLRIWQRTLYGEYKLLITCSKGNHLGWAFFEKPDHLPTPIKLGIFINDEKHFLSDQVSDAGNYLTAMFQISEDLASKMLTAHLIGVFIQPPNPNVFLGFKIETAKGRDKLSKIITGCHA
jgi:hypothetical protein